MPRIAIEFVPFESVEGGTVVLLVGAESKLGPQASVIAPRKGLEAVMTAAGFDGAPGKSAWAYALDGAKADAMLLLGLGAIDDMGEHDWIKLGGAIAGKLSGAGEAATIVLDPDGAGAGAAAALALGLALRSYRFDAYKTPKDDDDERRDLTVRIAVDDPDAAREAHVDAAAIAAGVETARDLVNEPPNMLGTEEFKDRAVALGDLGLDVEVLDEAAMRDLGMGSLLCVAQGSERPPYLVAMRWNGGAKGDEPVAFVGKGVVFDSGGISIKPGAGMGDMKGDMGGAAAVTGLMHALAARKAKANVVGVIGLVENMPDGKATRPGDIVRAMDGQTIEVLNTDAEGRLVLADALIWTRRTYEPRFMVDLATLTGAILVALGGEHAGMFSNDDELAGQLSAAGEATHEKVWRMPLGKAYDKMIDSKNADMKNIGGRNAGSITAAQFLQRFVSETPWAHLDIAGTAMNSPTNEYSQGWASGYGVRLLDRLVRDVCEG